jgi:NTP pyrophosphatase (non-canonical NTP hydrolase)
MSDVIEHIFKISEQVKNDRNITNVMLSTMSEIGELSTEVEIHSGISYKTPSDDGVFGEAIDCIICLVDLIKTHNPDVTIQEIEEYVKKKCNKWVQKNIGD